MPEDGCSIVKILRREPAHLSHSVSQNLSIKRPGEKSEQNNRRDKDSENQIAHYSTNPSISGVSTILCSGMVRLCLAATSGAAPPA